MKYSPTIQNSIQPMNKSSRKPILILAMLFLLVGNVFSQSKKSELFYYESISNPSKTTNFVIGFYPSLYTYEAALNNNEGASTIKMAIINNADGDYVWKNYRIIVQLTNGETFTNYTTSSSEGQYSCKYIVEAKKTHYQYLCFSNKFDPKKISRVFLLIDDGLFDLQKSTD